MIEVFNNYKFKIILGAVLIVAFGFLLFFPRKTSLQSISSDIIKFCEKSASRQNCYDNEIPKILDKGVTFEESATVIKLIQDKDGGYWFCHAVAHKLSAKEYYRNPNNWKEIMIRSPMGICSNGFLHGALQAHFSSAALNGAEIKELMPELQVICEKRESWSPTNQQQSSCYHELGHLSMYLTGGKVVLAGDICLAVSLRADGRDFTQTCNEGIFMQVFEPREPDDFGLIYNLVPEREKLKVCEKYTDGVEKGGCWKIGWEKSYKNFCDGFKGDLKYACYREAWVIESENLNTANDVINYCLYSEDAGEKKKCFNKLFYGLMSSDNFETTRVKAICLGLTKEIKSQCFANIASRLIETDKRLSEESVKICREAESYGVGSECYNELVHYAGFVFIPNSDDFQKFCKVLPNKYKNECLDIENN